ncbi:MAG: CRTAC1 family protein [Candidatus Eisenbacteria bacterium]|nr:CRTAC1 family protein [Candidatus Eisenbacteria bacterium]
MSDLNTPIDPNDEREQYGDEVLGKALKVSAVVFVGLAVVAGLVYYLGRPEEAVVEERVTPLEAPVAQAMPEAEVPRTPFVDVTKQMGITFVHENGAVGDKLLPESMGGGVAFFDFDSDGDPDLLFVNGTPWPEQRKTGAAATTAALYRNDRGKFVDVTRGSGLDVPIYGMGVATADYDGDGLVDVFFTAVGSNHLFRNLGGGKFEDVTKRAGVGGDAGQWSSSASWFDLDRDGDLDLFVCNYVKWSREIDFEVDYSLTGIGRAYGPPTNFEGAFSYLYRNEGDGTFTDIASNAGVQVRNASTGVPAGKSLAVLPVDIDQDGWIDLVVANDTVPNMVFRNLGNGTFEERGSVLGLAFDSYGKARGAMGIDAGNFMGDDAIAIAIGNFANEMTALYVADEVARTYTDEAIGQGIGPATRQSLTFGLFFFDYDLDGWLDLLQVNGHLEEEIQKVQESQTYEQSAQLFWNASATSRGFKPVTTAEAGADLFKPIVGRGSAFADIDGDGDLDVVFTQASGPPMLLRNDQDLGHHWLRVELRDESSKNRYGVGADVFLHAGDETQRQRVQPTRSYLSQSEPVATFGLGPDTQIDSIEIRWPDGSRQVVQNPGVDRVLRIPRASES